SKLMEKEEERKSSEGQSRITEFMSSGKKGKGKEKARSPPARSPPGRSPPARSRQSNSSRTEEIEPEAEGEPIELEFINPCTTLKDIYRTPTLLFLSYTSEREAGLGFLMVITDEEAINFHTTANNQERTCYPFEIVILQHVPEGTDAEDARAHFHTFLNNLRNSIIEQ